MNIKPYYQSDRATLYVGDALTVLPSLPTGSADLVATDPPYGIGFVSDIRTDKFDKILGDDSTDIGASVIEQSIRVLRNGRHLYAFGPWQETLEQHPQVSTPVQLIWNKAGAPGLGNLKTPYGSTHEVLYFVSKNSKKSGRGALSARLRQGTVLSTPRKAASKYQHPTEKPVALMRQLIESSSLVGDIVLDPFAGSGSTLVAAIITGRKAIGIELDEQYADVIIERLERAEELAEQIEAA